MGAKQAQTDDQLIARFNERAGKWGGYLPNTAPDKKFPFQLNGIWLSHEEAVEVDEGYDLTLTPQVCYNYTARTLYPLQWEADNLRLNGQFKNSLYEVVNFSEVETLTLIDFLFYFAKIKTIIGLDASKVTNINAAFVGATLLVDLELKGLNCDLALYDSVDISLESLRYIVTNAINEEQIKIEVNLVVFNKLTDSSNSEWNSLYQEALERNIIFDKR